MTADRADPADAGGAVGAGRAADARAATIRGAAGGIGALVVATFVAITTEMVPVGLLPLISDDLGVTESVAGLLVTAYAFMVAVLAVPLTLGTRRLPRKGLLLTTLVIYTASNVLVAFAPTFAVVAAARSLGGVAHAVFFSVSIGYASRLVRPYLTGRALALVTAGGTAGFVLGVPLSTALGTATDWRTAFLVLAGVCALATAMIAVVLPPVPGGGAPPADAARSTRRTALALAVTVNGLTFLGQYTVYTYVSVLLLAAGLGASTLGPVLLVLGALGLVGTAYAAARLDSHQRRTAVVALATIGAGMLVVGLTFPGIVGVLVAAAVWSTGFGAAPSVLQTSAIRTHGASPDMTGALVNTTANIGIGGGAALGGAVLAGVGLGVVPFVGAALVAGALGVVLLARRTFPNPNPTTSPESLSDDGGAPPARTT